MLKPQSRELLLGCFTGTVFPLMSSFALGTSRQVDLTSLLSFFSAQVPETVCGLRGCRDVWAGVNSQRLAADTCCLGKVPVPPLQAED